MRRIVKGVKLITFEVVETTSSVYETSIESKWEV